MPAVYDRFARFYDRLFAPLESLGLRKWRAETLAMLPANARVLEIGSGAGANFEFYEPSNTAISSEISIKMLEVSATKRRENHLIQADAQSLPFAENSFDAAFATLVFCSIPDPAKAFSEVRHVVRPGGTVVLLEHVRPPGFLGKIFDVLSLATVKLFDDHFDRETANLAAASGLEVTEVREKLLGTVNLIVCKVVE